MNNVITLSVPSRILPLEARLAALLGLFAENRRVGADVFWLKENAEVLNILESSGTPVPAEALAIHAGFYAHAMERLQFFPQYYRFMLSLVLDLESLGMPGDVGERVVQFAAREGLVGAELSDLQRAEARRLMERRNVSPLNDPGLDDRLRDFAGRSRTFALPNKKAAYELTHIVFYLGEYGRRDPQLGAEVVQSLHFAGLVAFLDQNADLLSEICIALHFMREHIPEVWTAWLHQETQAFGFESGEHVSLNDDYHEFLVCNWYAAVSGQEPFRKALVPGRTRFDRAPRGTTALREISQMLLAFEDGRSGDWDVMRRRMDGALSPAARDVLDMASASTDAFGAFFEGFARAGRA